jgi:hypothetical protein
MPAALPPSFEFISFMTAWMSFWLCSGVRPCGHFAATRIASTFSAMLLDCAMM